MIEIVDVERPIQLSDYEAVAGIGPTLTEVGHEARQAVKRLAGRRVWLLSGADARGALVENLPALLALLRDCGIDAHWARSAPATPELAALHLRLRQLVLGAPSVNAVFDEHEARRFAEAGEQVAEALAPQLDRGDILIAHGFGTAAAGAALKKRLGLKALWRNVVGLDDRTPATRAAWRFLKDHLTPYDRGLFVCAEYIPQYFTNRASLLPPAIDPLNHKNRDLTLHQVVGTLSSAGLLPNPAPTLARPFAAQARRLNRHGELQAPGELELLFRPTVTQISSWDRLNGMRPLLEAFAGLKQQLARGGLTLLSDRQRRRIEIARLVLAGPDPSQYRDDDQQLRDYQQLLETYLELDPAIAEDIAVIALPVASATEHALIINALQRVSTVLVQNSLSEGFGLGVTEAAFKRVPVLGGAASGIRLQIRHQIDGLLCQAPEDPDEVGKRLLQLLNDEEGRPRYAASAQRRVFREFLITRELRSYLRLFSEMG